MPFSLPDTDPTPIFEAYRGSYSTELLTAYGAMPADAEQRQTFFDAVDAANPTQDWDWDVPTQMLAYPDIPNHQSYVPDYPSVRSAMQAFGNQMRTTEGLDIAKMLGEPSRLDNWVHRSFSFHVIAGHNRRVQWIISMSRGDRMV